MHESKSAVESNSDTLKLSINTEGALHLDSALMELHVSINEPVVVSVPPSLLHSTHNNLQISTGCVSLTFTQMKRSCGRKTNLLVKLGFPHR